MKDRFILTFRMYDMRIFGYRGTDLSYHLMLTLCHTCYRYLPLKKQNMTDKTKAFPPNPSTFPFAEISPISQPVSLFLEASLYCAKVCT